MRTRILASVPAADERHQSAIGVSLGAAGMGASTALAAIGTAYWYHKTGGPAELGGMGMGIGTVGLISSAKSIVRHAKNLRRN